MAVHRSKHVRTSARAALCLAAALFAARPAAGFEPSSVGHHEGEIDINVHFLGQLGQSEPTERPTSWQHADIKALSAGAGYGIGRLGPLYDAYVRADGTYYNAAEEQVESTDDDLPAGYKFFGRDRGGYLSLAVSANLIHEPTFSFGLFLQGTAPFGVDLEKFSSVHLHFVAGGTTVSSYLTDPGRLIRLAYFSRLFVGSGAYGDGHQHNASVALTNLFYVEATRWILPWRVGLGLGPCFEGDVNEHVNDAYYRAYASVDSDLVAGDRIRSLRLSVAVLPYIRITDNAAVELGFVQKLFGYDTPAAQTWTGGVRTTF